MACRCTTVVQGTRPRYITEHCKRTSPALQDDDESKFTLDEEEAPPAGGSPAAAAVSTQVRAQLRPVLCRSSCSTSVQNLHLAKDAHVQPVADLLRSDIAFSLLLPVLQEEAQRAAQTRNMAILSALPASYVAGRSAAGGAGPGGRGDPAAAAGDARGGGGRRRPAGVASGAQPPHVAAARQRAALAAAAARRRAPRVQSALTAQLACVLGANYCGMLGVRWVPSLLGKMGWALWASGHDVNLRHGS